MAVATELWININFFLNILSLLFYLSKNNTEYKRKLIRGSKYINNVLFSLTCQPIKLFLKIINYN